MLKAAFRESRFGTKTAKTLSLPFMERVVA